MCTWNPIDWADLYGEWDCEDEEEEQAEEEYDCTDCPITDCMVYGCAFKIIQAVPNDQLIKAMADPKKTIERLNHLLGQ